MVLFGQKWFYSRKLNVVGKKLLYSGKGGCIWTRWLYLDKVVVFGEKWLYSRKRGCIRTKWL